VVLLLYLAIVAAYAQTSPGSISGSITDPNGASIPGAKIEATETATGRTYRTQTTEAGLYVPGSALISSAVLPANTTVWGLDSFMSCGIGSSARSYHS
jgi:hypothetical protein